MKFSQLHEIVPLVRHGKAKVLTMHPYHSVALGMPGRHAEDTSPKGGDFVVMVDDETMGWTRHQFTHSDLFLDIENKTIADSQTARNLVEDYLWVVATDADVPSWNRQGLPGLHPQTFLYAVQCLAVAEHRRYWQHESKAGGRFLPLRFAAGIAEGHWSAADASKVQRYGRSAVERLEKVQGTPQLTNMLQKALAG